MAAAERVQPALSVEPALRARYGRAVLKLLALKLLPFMSRWTEAAPAVCCGHCGPCITSAVTGVALEIKSSRSSD